MFTAIRKWVISQMLKTDPSGVVKTLPKQDLIELNTRITADRLIKNGIDPNSLTSPNQVENVLNQIDRPKVIPADSPEGRGITEKLFRRRGKVVDMEGKEIPPGSRIMGGKAVEEEKTNPKFLDYTVKRIKGMEPMDAMKEANLVIGRKGDYKNLTKEDAKKILDETEDHIFERNVPRSEFDPPDEFAKGGIARIGLKKGMTRRAFLQLMGGVGAMGAAAKTGLLKLTGKQAAKELVKTPSLPGKPEWFDSLVNKVIQEGTDVSKTFAYKDRQTVHRKALNEAEEVMVYRDLDTGAVDVQYGPAGNRASNDPEVISFEYKPGQMEEGVKGKTPDEFIITEAEPRYTGGPGDTDIEFDGERFVDNVDDLMQDISNLKQFATGKKMTLKEFVDARKKRKKFEEFSENQLDQAEYLETKYGPGPEPDIDDQFASGGIAGMLGE